MSTPSQPVGQTVSHYRILSRIGRGGMGEFAEKYQVTSAHFTLIERDITAHPNHFVLADEGEYSEHEIDADGNCRQCGHPFNPHIVVAYE